MTDILEPSSGNRGPVLCTVWLLLCISMVFTIFRSKYFLTNIRKYCYLENGPSRMIVPYLAMLLGSPYCTPVRGEPFNPAVGIMSVF